MTDSVVKKLTWGKIVTYLIINSCIAGLILWSSMGGPSLIETLFPTVLGIIYTCTFILLLIFTVIMAFVSDVKDKVKEGFRKQSKTDPLSLWNIPKRIVGSAGTAFIIVALAQAEWGYVMTMAIMTMMLSYVMVGQMKSLYEEAWENYVEVEAEDGHSIEADLIIAKRRD